MSNRIKGFSIYLQVKAGEEAKNALFNSIWHQYYQRVWFFSAGILKGKKAVIDDAVQEIMLKVFSKLDTYKPWYSFSTWIFTISRNTCLNWKNKKDFKTSLPVENLVDSRNKNPEQILLEKDTRQRLGNFINNLSQQEAQIVYLRFYENLKIKKISQVMHIPVGTIKYKIHNIKQNLKSFLREEDYVN